MEHDSSRHETEKFISCAVQQFYGEKKMDMNETIEGIEDKWALSGEPFEILLAIFGGYSGDFEYTATGIFRRTKPPVCPECGMPMNYNGYNTYGKIGLGSVKIGRYICPCCGGTCEEERDFWEKLKWEFFGVINRITQLMRLHHVSYQGISDILELIYPRGKDTFFNDFAGSVERTAIPPPAEDIQIILYDEQHPKAGRLRTTGLRTTIQRA